MPKITANSLSFEPTRIGLATQFKWLAFRFLEWLSDLRGNAVAVPLEIGPAAHSEASIWVFVSTIGELNAIDPFLKKLVSHFSHLKLVLITDHPHYLESYRSRYPDSAVVVSMGHSNDARQLAERFRPELLVVGEIPCWPGDAPCRFSFAFLIEAKRRGARACVVNGWLYYYPPSCRMDQLERQLFHADYLNAFDLLAVQTEGVKSAMVEQGADPARIHVVGNLKFDALPPADWSPQQAKSPKMLSAMIAVGRPVIVAGCVTEYEDQNLVLDAFQQFRSEHPDALLVIAPRHPEVSERMAMLEEFLGHRDIPFLFRSRIDDMPIAASVACLVLDTIGELRDVYAASNVAHVGVDHNVLEPLGFGKPVTVQPGWNETYPSYPVYCMLYEQGGLIQVSTAAELAASWLALLRSPEQYRDAQEKVSRVLENVRGAVDRHWSVFLPLFQAGK